MENNIVVFDRFGGEVDSFATGDMKIVFEPGWSTGREDGPYQNGLSVGIIFLKPFKVGGLFNFREVGRRNAGGIVPKEQAIKLAYKILEHYGK